VAEGEAVGKHLVRALAWLFFRTKRATGRLPRALRWLLMPLLRWFSGRLLGGRSLAPPCACAPPRPPPHPTPPPPPNSCKPTG
jgi:hypothetical protein